MQNVQILTERKFDTGVSHQVLFEWEDEIAGALGLKCRFLSNFKYHYFARLARKLNCVKPIKWKPRQTISLYLVMNIDHLRLTTWYVSNTIPIIFDVEEREIDDLIKLTKKLPVYFVTCYSIIQRIKEIDPENRGQYVPQFATQKWAAQGILVKNRSLDMIQYGRRDPKLHEYAVKYCNANPDVSYMWRESGFHGSNMVILKNGETEVVLPAATREEFMHQLLNAKVALCSTPEASGTRFFGDGIDFLTARWFECLACGNQIIAHVSNHVSYELQYTKLNSVVNRVDSFEEFEKHVTRALSLTMQGPERNDVVVCNLAGTRAKQIMRVIADSIGGKED